MKTVVCGRDVEYGVEEKTGKFMASWNGERYESNTLTGMKGQLERQMKKKPLNIPVLKIEIDYHDEKLELVKGVIVGKHSGNGNLIIQWGDLEAEQFSSYGSTLLKATVDTKRLKKLFIERTKANKAWDEFKNENSFDKHNIPELEEES